MAGKFGRGMRDGNRTNPVKKLARVAKATKSAKSAKTSKAKPSKAMLKDIGELQAVNKEIKERSKVSGKLFERRDALMKKAGLDL